MEETYSVLYKDCSTSSVLGGDLSGALNGPSAVSTVVPDVGYLSGRWPVQQAGKTQRPTGIAY